MPDEMQPVPNELLIDDLDTLRVLADPVRMRILEAMVRRLEEWTVKELARATAEATEDITLFEMQECLRAERGITASVGTIWTFLDRCNMTVKKDRPRGGAGPS